MHYVYILRSTEGDHFYVGHTDDLRSRVKSHNAGNVRHTSKYRPWKLCTYLAFSHEDRAIAFEKYLKSGSGRAFAAKRLGLLGMLSAAMCEAFGSLSKNLRSGDNCDKTGASHLYSVPKQTTGHAEIWN